MDSISVLIHCHKRLHAWDNASSNAGSQVHLCPDSRIRPNERRVCRHNLSPETAIVDSRKGNKTVSVVMDEICMLAR